MTHEAPMTETQTTSHQARRPGVFGAKGSRQHLVPSSLNDPAGLGAFAGQTVIGHVPQPGSSAKPAARANDAAAAEHTRPTTCHSGFVIPSSFAIRYSSLPRSGFTLVEILVVLSILVLMLGISIVSISGVKEEDRLRRAVAVIEITARESLLQAVKCQQTVRMGLSTGSLGSASDFGGKLEIRRVGERSFRQPRQGEIWEFSPTGICEPIEVRLSGSGGTVELAFDALTACAKRKSLDFNAKS